MALQWLVFPICYLLGSLSPSHAIVWATRRLDLRTTGSGHLGATAAFTAGGIWPGIIALLGDVAKGALAACIARWAFGRGPLALLGLAAVVLGHCFPIFYRFQGGKGFAASCGALLVLAPQLLLPLVSFSLVIAFITENMTPPDQGHLIGMAMTAALPATTALLLPGAGNLIAMLFVTAIILAAYLINLPQSWRRGATYPIGWHRTRAIGAALAFVLCFALLTFIVGPAPVLVLTAAAGLWASFSLLLLATLACATRQLRLIAALGSATAMAYVVSVVAALVGGHELAPFLSAMLAGVWPSEVTAITPWAVLAIHHLLFGAALAVGGMIGRVCNTEP